MSAAASQDIVEVPVKDKFPPLTFEQTKFVCIKRLEMEAKFQSVKTKSGPLWHEIWLEFKEVFPTAPQDQSAIQKRYHNMLTQYKKEAAEAKKSGAAPSKWPYYEIFKQVLHCRLDISLETMSTSTAQSIDMRPLTVSREPRNGQNPSTSLDNEEAEIEQTLREFAGMAPDKEREKPKRPSASKDQRTDKKQKFEDELFDTYSKTTSDLRSAFEKVTTDHAERVKEEAACHEETRAYRAESLKVGLKLAEYWKPLQRRFLRNNNYSQIQHNHR